MIDAIRIAYSTVTYKKDIFFSKSDFHVNEDGTTADYAQFDVFLEDVPKRLVEIWNPQSESGKGGDFHIKFEKYIAPSGMEKVRSVYWGFGTEGNSLTTDTFEATGKNELLAPRIENQNTQFTKAILFAKVPFELTTKEDRMRTCYMQACLAYVNFEGISNSDIRKIFGLGEKEKAKASRLLTSAVDGGYIKVMDPDTAPRYKKYIPYWA